MLVLEPEELINAKTGVPEKEVLILPELMVNRWETRAEDTDGKKHSFIGTKWGGNPEWIQNPEDFPAPFYFVAQLDYGKKVQLTNLSDMEIVDTYEFNGNMSYQVQLVGEELHWISELGDNMYYCPFANFGDAGVGYLFVDPNVEKPSGKFVWQCF